MITTTTPTTTIIIIIIIRDVDVSFRTVIYCIVLQTGYEMYTVYNWRDALVTVINRRKLTDAQANPSTQRKRYLSPI